MQHLGGSHLCLIPCTGISTRRMEIILYFKFITIKQTYNNFKIIYHISKNVSNLYYFYLHVEKKFY